MEVTPTQLIQLLREGTAPLKARTAIARGTLPLPPAALLESLDILADDPDHGVRSEAQESLGRLPESLVTGVVSSTGLAAGLLDRLARRFRGNAGVALAIARNRAAADATVALLATLPFPEVLEVVGRNQARLEGSPETVAALLANPETPLGIVQLWQEHKERRAAAEKASLGDTLPADEREPEGEAADFDRVLVEEVDDGEEAVRTLAADHDAAPSARQLSIYALLKKMTIGQKVALAVKGNREVRNILIHEANRMLCLKVLDNPRLGEGDVEAYAKSTNISVDILRAIANRKEWVKQYAIVKSLVCNPRTPLGVSLDFIKRLTKKDLEQLAKNRNVPETVRNTARRLFTQKRDANQ